MASLQPLKTILRTHLPTIRSSPCLLITSSPPPDSKSPEKTIHDFVQSNTQLLIAQNIKSIPVTIDAAFPTAQKVDETLKLAQRAGVKDGVVFGVGSGPAIDLAKALSTKLHDGDGTLILAPATLGGMYAACSSDTLFLDTKEEMLLPQSTGVNADIAYDDAKYFSCAPLFTADKGLSMAHVAAALLTVALDSSRKFNGQHEKLNDVALSCASVLNSATNKSKSIEAQQHLMNAITQLPKLQSRETIPQTLTNALLPTYFPQSHILTLLGCMLPGLCQTFDANGVNTDLAQFILDNRSAKNSTTLSEWATTISKETGIPSMASLAFGTPDMNALLDKVDAYSTLRVGNNDEYLLSEVLERSLNR